MPCISEKKTWKKCSIEVIVDIDVNSIYIQLNEKAYRNKIGYSNLPIATNKYDPVYAKHKSELVHEPKYQPSRRFIHNDLAEQLVRTLWTDKIDAFRRSL